MTRNNNHFFISYAGNKRNEANDFINLIENESNFNNIKNIIEPFCGSAAISFHIWKKYGNKFNYYLNDKSNELKLFYELFKTETIDNINNQLNKIKELINNKEEWNNYLKNGEETIYKKYFFYKYSNLGRYGMYPINRNFHKIIKLSNIQLEFINFIKSPNVFITYNDWETIFNEYKNDEKSIFIIDPPYVNSCNDFYIQKNLNIYQYFYDNQNLNFKSNIYFILEDIWMIRILFNKYKILKVYEKKYELSKKITNHIILFNKN